MNIFGVGPLEIIVVIVIGILVLGPEGMVEAGKKLGKFLRSIVTSTWWQGVRRSVNELQHLPQRLMREAELEELKELQEIREITNQGFPELPKIDGDQILQNSSWTGSDTTAGKSDPDPQENDSNPDPKTNSQTSIPSES
jgi:Sec-independent protein translocase protein TatA